MVSDIWRQADKGEEKTRSISCSFAFSALACFSIGISRMQLRSDDEPKMLN